MPVGTLLQGSFNRRTSEETLLESLPPPVHVPEIHLFNPNATVKKDP